MSVSMTPDEWQTYCHQLARLRHGEHNYQVVPDHDRGDLGIESFALDGTDCVYQCYVTEALDTAGRLKARQRKMTTDLGKLQRNDKKLVVLLGFKIKRWILLVPEYDSKGIVEHAAKKSRDVVALRLECVDCDDFRALVQDDDAFATERAKLLEGGVVTAPVDVAGVDEEEVERWAVENAAEVETLDQKLMRLVGHHRAAAEQSGAVRREFLDFHLFGQNYAEQLSSRYPELYEAFVRAKTREEEDLRLRSLTASGSPAEHLAAVLEQYEERLKRRVPGLDLDDIRNLSWAGVAEWMIRCPLDFPASDQ